MSARVLRPYQETGRDFLAARRRAGLLDEPGLGKTTQALAAADQLGLGRILVVCPAIGRVSWIKEAEHQHMPRKVMLADGKPIPAGPVLVIASFDQIGLAQNKPLRDQLRKSAFDLVVVDEAHYAKSHAANRTKALYGKTSNLIGGLCDGVDHVWLLSGTLMPNHAGELWTHVNALFPEVYPDLGFNKLLTRVQWEDKFCKVRDTVYGRQITGSRNLEVLREAMAPHFLRRRKADVLDDLPPLDFVDQEIEVTAPEDVANLLPDTYQGLSDDEFLEALAGQEAHLATQRRALGIAKCAGAAAWADDLLQSGAKKVILFAVHKTVIERLATYLADFNPVCLDGGTPHPDRLAAVDRFQMDPACRVFIGQIQAAGTAITLTAAKDVAIVEPSWTPSDNYQAACRAHRIGQKDGVLCRFLFAPGSLDARIMRVCRRKAAEIATMFE